MQIVFYLHLGNRMKYDALVKDNILNNTLTVFFFRERHGKDCDNSTIESQECNTEKCECDYEDKIYHHGETFGNECKEWYALFYNSNLFTFKTNHGTFIK